MNRTASQQKAIDSEAQRILCVAGPGAGKTTVLVGRIDRLINSGVEPGKIVALTFTNAAALELQHRIEGGAGKIISRNEYEEAAITERHKPRLGYIGTLHGFALKMLKAHGAGIGYGARLAIIDAEASADLLQAKARQMGCKTKLEKLLELKAKGRPQRNLRSRISVEETVLCAYFDDLREAGIVDFDLILSEFLRMLTEPLYNAAGGIDYGTHLFVDEVQDSSEQDWRIYQNLPIRNKFLVGDPDQAIYGFRGGRVDVMVAVANGVDYDVIRLEENFRSFDEICAAANLLIWHNNDRVEKATISASGPGGTVDHFPAQTADDERAHVCQMIASGLERAEEIAVLARTNAIASEMRQALQTAGLPVQQAAKLALPRDWHLARAFVEWLAQPDNDTLAYFFLIARERAKGSTDLEARGLAHSYRLEAQRLGHSINSQWFGHQPGDLPGLPAALAKAGISAEARAMIAGLIRQLPAGADLLELALAMGLHLPEEKPASAGVECLTIHGAKGREWDVVFLVGFEDECCPGKRGDPEEERRLAYVALTRARLACHISSAKARQTPWGAVEPRTPSRYIKEMLP